MSRSSAHRPSTEAGFTLLEALVAMAILAMVVIYFLGTRTEALIDAADARNWRLAREFAERYLSEIQAGSRDIPPENRSVVEIEGYPRFSYQVLIGEAAISDVETEMAGTFDETAPPGASSRQSGTQSQRVAWQQERDMKREAQARGLEMYDYQDQLREEELEQKDPSETDLEDVAVVVFFPNVRPSDDPSATRSHFMLKAKISTLALACLTPDEAERETGETGQAPEGGAAAGAGGAGER